MEIHRITNSIYVIDIHLCKRCIESYCIVHPLIPFGDVNRIHHWRDVSDDHFLSHQNAIVVAIKLLDCFLRVHPEVIGIFRQWFAQQPLWAHELIVICQFYSFRQGVFEVQILVGSGQGECTVRDGFTVRIDQHHRALRILVFGILVQAHHRIKLPNFSFVIGKLRNIRIEETAIIRDVSRPYCASA